MTTHPTLRDLITDLSAVVDIPVTDIQSKCRLQRLVIARCIFSLMAYIYTTQSIQKIGKFVKRDHTTVMYQRDLAIDLLKSNDYLFVKVWDKYKSQSEILPKLKVAKRPNGKSDFYARRIYKHLPACTLTKSSTPTT